VSISPQTRLSVNQDLLVFYLLLIREKAHRDFGYHPPYSLEEGIQRTLTAFGHLRNPKAPPKSSSPAQLKGTIGGGSTRQLYIIAGAFSTLIVCLSVRLFAMQYSQP